MAGYKLMYFNARGGAEVMRFIFAQAGVAYEDKRVEREDWPKVKPTTPTGQLPLLEVEGKTLTGSRPIARYLAEKFGLAGNDGLQNAEIAAIVDLLSDFLQKVYPWFYEKDEERKKQLGTAIREEHLPKYWSILENWIQTNNAEGGWIYGNKVTYADFSIYCSLDIVAMIGVDDFFTKYPGVAKLKSSVEALPNIAKWIKERPKTEH